MKKLITLLLVLTGCVGTTRATDITVYFMPNDNWKENGATFALIAQQQNTSNQVFAKFSEISSGIGVYSATFTYDSNFNEFFLFRMPSSYDGNTIPWNVENWNHNNSALSVPSSTTYYSMYGSPTGDNAYNYYSYYSTTNIPDFNGYYLTSNVNSWTRETQMIEVSSGTFNCAFSGSDYSAKLIAWAPGYAFNANNTVEQWGYVLRPNENDNKNFWINFANYTHNTLYTATGANKSVWYLPQTGIDDQVTNEGNVTITYTPASNSATITCTKTTTIGTASYTTWSNGEKYKVSGATAYTVTNMGTYAQLNEQEADIVYPAGTGLILAGSGDVTISAVASDATPAVISGNALSGTGNSATEIAANSYVLWWDGTNASSVGFKKTTAGTLAAHKAYIPAPVTPAPEFLGFSFGDTPTGINTLKGEELKVNGEYYNLNGQRVAQPTKGLYIVNGRKVVIK